MLDIVAARPTETSHSHSIDWTRPFAPERMTPLAYTPLFGTLSGEERLRYNQHFALYVNEKIAYLEEELSHFMLAVAKLPRAAHLRPELLSLVQDEQRHATGFKALNRRAAPQLYGARDRLFVQPGKAVERLTRGLAQLPTVFPLLLWIILLQEERSVYYSQLFTEEREFLEPNFVAIHERHSQDEAAHVAVDEQLIRLLWDDAPHIVRWANGHLLARAFSEFLYYPKRAAVEVLRISLAGHPLLDLMVSQVLALRYDRNFLSTTYNRTTNPETLFLMDRYPELRPLAQVMAGYDL